MRDESVGILAIQGDFAAHIRALAPLGISAVEVRTATDLEHVDALIIPGGESTTMLKFLDEERLAEPIKEMARREKPLFGTCAGAILLARQVVNPDQSSLGLIDIEVERNAYGRQVDSFIGEAQTTLEGGPLEAVFIRAPRIIGRGPGVEVLARIDQECVLAREGNILVATFHPELARDERVHQYFVEMVRQPRRAAPPSEHSRPKSSGGRP